MTKSVILAITVFCGLVFSSFLYGQSAGTGALAGTITDSTGASVPGATVLATNADTGLQRTVTTAADGAYQIPLLPPGPYNVKVTAQGFKALDIQRVTVAITETAVLDRSLQVGTQAEEVTVDATVEAVQTSNATLGSSLGATQVAAIPLTTRNYTNMLALSAGVSASVTNASTFGKAGMDLSANGALPGENNMQIDGMNVATQTSSGSNADNFSTFATTPVPNPDSLQEFKVQTSSYDAGYGRNAGANINAITKSGTNQFHGTAFEFFRNTDLNANDFFLNRGGKAKGVLNQNQYGGVIGGPIIKDKLFFFGSYQGTNQKNGFASQANSALTLVPLPTGDRSNTDAFKNALGAAFCPANHPGTAYQTLRGGTQVACDGSNINPVALSILQYKFPNGNYLIPGSTNGGFQSSNISIPAYYKEYQGTINMDYVLSSKNTLSARTFTSYAPGIESFLAAQQVPGFTSNWLTNYNTALLKLTTVVSSSMVNEARISWHRDVAQLSGNDSNLSSHQFGINPLSPVLDNTIPGFMTTFVIGGAFTVGSDGILSPSLATTSTYQAADQLSWTHGKHTIRTGFELEQARWTWNYFGEGSGVVNISTISDFLVGLPGCAPPATTCSTPGTNGTAFSNIASTTSSDAESSVGTPHQWRIPYYSGFVQDDYKLSSRLTINLGLRYEYDGMMNEIYGLNTAVWPTAVANTPIPGNTPATGSLSGWVEPANFINSAYYSPSLLAQGLTIAGNNSSLHSGPPKDNFAPRLGFAWQPFGGSRFVVRGGAGYFYDRVPGGSWVNGVNNSPPEATPATNTGQPNYYASDQSPWKPGQNGVFTPRWADFNAVTSSSIQQQVYDEDWHTPLIYNYNLGIQYQFAPSWVLEAGYVGSHGIHITGGDNINVAQLASSANPVYGLTTNTVSNAILRVPNLGYAILNDQCECLNTRYNSLQVTVRKQLSHGFQLQAAYTWARDFNSFGTPIPNNLEANWQLGSSYHPQRVSINYLWNIPTFRNPQGFLGKLESGWQLSGVTTIQDGTPLTITDGRGATIYGLASATAQILPGSTYSQLATPGSLGSRLGGTSGGCGFFTSAAVTGSVNGTTCGNLSVLTTIPNAVVNGVTTNGTGYGNMGSGVMLGPGQFNFDASLSKTTRVGGIHENATLQFRAEFFNMFNHPQFSNPALVDSSATFGQITSTSVNPRLVQLALKYIF